MVKLSERLHHLADMVTEGNVLADVGTDHGFIPIYLIETGRISRAIAMDIGLGPLHRAIEHIAAFGLGEYIEARLSDGVAALAPKEVDTILIAGMGGGIMLHILEAGKNVVTQAKELILQPQSEIEKVRAYLYLQGYTIDREDMVYEEGKYYPMMHVLPKQNSDSPKEKSKEEWQVIYRYGEHLLADKNDALYQYLIHIQNQYEKIAENLERQTDTEAIRERSRQIKEELFYINMALLYWKG